MIFENLQFIPDAHVNFCTKTLRQMYYGKLQIFTQMHHAFQTCLRLFYEGRISKRTPIFHVLEAFTQSHTKYFQSRVIINIEH